MENHTHWFAFQRQLEDVIEAVQNRQLTPIVTPGGQPLLVATGQGSWTRSKDTLAVPWSQTDEAWFRTHYREVVNRFTNRWVAIKDERVVAWYDQADGAWVRLNPAQPIDLEHCLVEYAGGTRPL